MGAARDGFYWARSDQYEIHRYDSLGTLRQVIRRPVEPERMTSADEQEYREAAIAGAREAGGDRAAQGVVQRLRDATFAPTRPLFGSTFVDRDGRLWISELPWPSRFVAPRRWSVFSETGEWLGEVLVPQDFWVQDASGDRVVGIWRDELGVSFVRIHRMGNSD
jgi:sugar lactone lactonase YvrE